MGHFKLYYMDCKAPSSNHLMAQLVKEASVYEGIELLPGSMISVGVGEGWMKFLRMRHIGIYLGHINEVPYVVHFTNSGLRLDPLGDGWRDSPKLEYTPTSSRVYQNAWDRLLHPEDEGKYELLTNNCISFVRRCLKEEGKAFGTAVGSWWLKMKYQPTPVYASTV